MCAFSEKFRRTRSIINDEQRHDDLGSHVVEPAGQEVVCFHIGSLFNGIDGLLIKFYHVFYTILQRFHLVTTLGFEHFLDEIQVSAIGDISHCGYHLQLRGTLIDGENARVAIQALALIFHDEARPSVDRDGVVGILVGIFRVHSLGQRRESIGHALIFLHLLAFLRGEGAFAGNILQCLVNVDVTCRLIKQRAACIQLGLHARNHIIHRRERDNLLAELSTFLGIVETLAIGFLLHAHALCRYTQTGTIHQRHHIFDEA